MVAILSTCWFLFILYVTGFESVMLYKDGLRKRWPDTRVWLLTAFGAPLVVLVCLLLFLCVKIVDFIIGSK